MPLHSFVNVTRIRVVNTANPLFGQCGRFVRKVRFANAAWIHMDEDLPLELQSPFPDAEKRLHDAVLYPEECEAVVERVQ